MEDSRITNDFFISYAVENWTQAKWIHQQLETHGYRIIKHRRSTPKPSHFAAGACDFGETGRTQSSRNSSLSKQSRWHLPRPAEVS